MDFSLLFFANREATDPPHEYDVLHHAAAFADDHDFTAVWVPERHFHPFGGAYPNPALAAGSLARATSRVRLRAGSVVLPLRDTLNVVEDWAFVDNLSRGRVDLALATGWIANDFVLAPDRFEGRKEYLHQAIPELRTLWAGGSVERVNGAGETIEVRTYPRPVQPDLDLWLTCASNPETFVRAGELGLNVLTALLFQKVTDLEPRIAAYRQARERAGHDPEAGTVTLMVHTFVAPSDDEARAAVEAPFKAYLDSAVDLWKNQWAHLRGPDRAQMLDFAFERYFRSAAMFGSVERCTGFVERLRQVGVGEVASLIDFGVPTDRVLASLEHLDRVRSTVQSAPDAVFADA